MSYAKTDQAIADLPKIPTQRPPTPSSRADKRRVYLRVLCPGGHGHTVPLVAGNDGHLELREHNIPTIGGGRVRCGMSGRNAHDADARTDHGHPVQCLCEGRAR